MEDDGGIESSEQTVSDTIDIQETTAASSTPQPESFVFRILRLKIKLDARLLGKQI